MTKKIKDIFKNKKVLVVACAIFMIIVIGIINLDKKEVVENKSQDIVIKNSNDDKKKEVKDIPKETKLTSIKKYNDDGIEVKFDINTTIDLNLHTGDDIFFKVVNKTNNETVIEKNKTWEEYILSDDKVVKDILQPGNYKCIFSKVELQNIDTNNLAIELVIRNDGSDIYNLTSSVVTFGDDGHIGIKSIAPESNEFGVRYKWQLSNSTNDKTNVLISNFEGNENLLSIDINPGEVVSVYTPCNKGDKLKVHTKQLDNSYLIKDVVVDESVIKFENVVSSSVSGDASSNGSVIKWKVKNLNSNAKANVIIRDGVGEVIMQFDLDANNEKVVDIDINRGRSIIVETRMGNGVYSGKSYSVSPTENKVDVLVNLLDIVDVNNNKICKVEFENVLNGKTNVIVSTGDDVNQLGTFDLQPNQKWVMDINMTYINSIMIKTKQFDGSYTIKVHDI